MKLKAAEIHRIRRGVKLPIDGAPRQTVDAGAPVDRVAIVAADYLGMRPRMLIQVGDEVKRGTPIFEDRRAPGILFTAPGAGTVAAVNRGDRRALQSVVITLDEGAGEAPEVTYPSYDGAPVAEIDADAAQRLLLESGLWTAFRGRPFDKVPRPGSTPDAIFVTAADSHPLSPSPTAVIRQDSALWDAGLAVLGKLVPSGRLYVIVDEDFDLPPTDGAAFHELRGRYPAGTPGLAMHRLHPVSRERTAWHIGYQDVIATGHLFTTGRQMVERVVALSGPGVAEPRLIRTRLGAPIAALTEGQLRGEGYRLISGSVLHGREVSADVTGDLGRYHRQITAIPEADERRFLGWLAPGFGTFSVTRLFASGLLRISKPGFSTDHHGGLRTLVPLGVFEKVWPFDLLATPLLRALLAEDVETAEALGCLELAEEDVAVLSFVCPSKIDYGRALRAMLDRIEEEG